MLVSKFEKKKVKQCVVKSESKMKPEKYLLISFNSSIKPLF